MKSFARLAKEEILRNFKPDGCCPGAYFTARTLRTGSAGGVAAAPPCCKKAYLTGAFLECGTVSLSGVYHLEFVLPREAQADDIAAMLTSFGFLPKKAVRGASFVVYLKESEAISDLLALLGASGAVLRLQSVKVDREMNNRINRASNCDVYNIGKSVDAAARQTAAIELVRARGGLKQLPEKLRAAAEIRLRHPEESMEELRARFDPPLSKSGINHRYQKILEIAEKIKKNT